LTESKPKRKFTDQMFLMQIFYEGPWARLEAFFLGLYQDNRDEVRWTIPVNPKGWRKGMNRLADWAEQRDMIWRAKYAIRNRNPPERWKR
jgi:hypothetical protein